MVIVFLVCNDFGKSVAIELKRKFGRGIILRYDRMSTLGRICLVVFAPFLQIWLPHLGGRIFKLVYLLKRQSTNFIDDGLAPLALERPPLGSLVYTFDQLVPIYRRIDCDRKYSGCGKFTLLPSADSVFANAAYIVIGSSGLAVPDWVPRTASSLYVRHPRAYKNSTQEQFVEVVAAMDNLEGALLWALCQGKTIVIGRTFSVILLELAHKSHNWHGKLVFAASSSDPMFDHYKTVLEMINDYCISTP
jgi:hypothetical protein